MKGTATSAERPRVLLLAKFSHPQKDNSAIILNEPQIIVMKYIKQNS